VKHWHILSYFFFTPLFLLVSIALTDIDTFSARLFDFHASRINPGTFGAALTSRCLGQSGSSMLLPCFISYSTSIPHSSPLSSGISRSPFQLSQSSVSEMVSVARSSSISTGWWEILQILRTFNICVCSPGRSFADKGGGNGDLSDNLNSAAPSC